MTRDTYKPGIVGFAEQIECRGRTWYAQEFCEWDGTFEGVNLYDEDGDFVCDFESMEELRDFIQEVVE